MAIGLIIRTDGTVESKEVRGLQNIYKAIGCTCIEGVRVDDGIMYIDEEGKFRQNKVVNRKATLIAWDHLGLRSDDYIIGDVIIFGTRSPDGDCDGEDYDFPEYFSKLLEASWA